VLTCAVGDRVFKNRFAGIMGYTAEGAPAPLSLRYMCSQRLPFPGVPYVGELRDKPGAFVCAGHHGHGMYLFFRVPVSRHRAHIWVRHGAHHDLRQGAGDCDSGWRMGIDWAPGMLSAHAGAAVFPSAGGGGTRYRG